MYHKVSSWNVSKDMARQFARNAGAILTAHKMLSPHRKDGPKDRGIKVLQSNMRSLGQNRHWKGTKHPAYLLQASASCAMRAKGFRLIQSNSVASGPSSMAVRDME